jgi:hypothetical protein
MGLDPVSAAARLESSGTALAALLGGVTPEVARWREAPGRWALLEILGHLADEERFDFRARLEHLLAGRADAFAPIDPQGWVESHRYLDAAPEVALEDFLAERRHSLTWLRGLLDADLSRVHALPKGGVLSAGEVLASWVAHDLLHLRQVGRVLYARAAADAAPFGVAYAGPW